MVVAAVACVPCFAKWLGLQSRSFRVLTNGDVCSLVRVYFAVRRSYYKLFRRGFTFKGVPTLLPTAPSWRRRRWGGEGGSGDSKSYNLLRFQYANLKILRDRGTKPTRTRSLRPRRPTHTHPDGSNPPAQFRFKISCCPPQEPRATGHRGNV